MALVQELEAEAACAELEALLAKLGASEASALRMPTARQLADRVVGTPTVMKVQRDSSGRIAWATFTEEGSGNLVRMDVQRDRNGLIESAVFTDHERLES